MSRAGIGDIREQFDDPWLRTAIDNALDGEWTLERLAALRVLEWNVVETRGLGSIQSLAGLELCSALEVLDLEGNRVSNLNPLAQLRRLRRLWLDGCDVRDLSPLRHTLALSAVSMVGNHALTEIESLSGLPGLQVVDLSGTGVVDLTPLGTMLALRRVGAHDLPAAREPRNRSLLVDLVSRGVAVRTEDAAGLADAARRLFSPRNDLEAMLLAYDAFGLLRRIRRDGLDAPAPDGGVLHAVLNRTSAEERVALVKSLIKAGAPLDRRDVALRTALLRACDRVEEGSDVIARMLVEAGADLERADAGAETPLSCAERRRRWELAELLVTHGADGSSPAAFDAICVQGTPERVARFLEGADLGERHRGRTPLHAAVSGGQVAVITMLLKAGAWILAKDAKGRTALHLAETPEVLAALMPAGPPLDAADYRGRVPLATMAERGNLAAMKALVRAGASLYKLDRAGESLLHHAVRSRNGAAARAMAAWLLELDPDFREVANDSGQRPADVASNTSLREWLRATP